MGHTKRLVRKRLFARYPLANKNIFAGAPPPKKDSNKHYIPYFVKKKHYTRDVISFGQRIHFLIDKPQILTCSRLTFPQPLRTPTGFQHSQTEIGDYLLFFNAPFEIFRKFFILTPSPKTSQIDVEKANYMSILSFLRPPKQLSPWTTVPRYICPSDICSPRKYVMLTIIVVPKTCPTCPGTWVCYLCFWTYAL